MADHSPKRYYQKDERIPLRNNYKLIKIRRPEPESEEEKEEYCKLLFDRDTSGRSRDQFQSNIPAFSSQRH
jgi:hypothetical protein